MPSEVNRYLDNNYEEWQLVEAPYYDDKGYIQVTSRKKGLNFTSGDYDGNSKQDYAMMIDFTNTNRQNNNGFETLILISFDAEFKKNTLDSGCSYE